MREEGRREGEEGGTGREGGREGGREEGREGGKEGREGSAARKGREKRGKEGIGDERRLYIPNKVTCIWEQD